LLTSSRIDTFSERLIEFAARIASGIKINSDKLAVVTGPSLSRIALDTITAVALELTTRNSSGLLYCKLCRKGPFTKRGMYLHLIRVHRYEIKALISEEFKERVKALSEL